MLTEAQRNRESEEQQKRGTGEARVRGIEDQRTGAQKTTMKAHGNLTVVASSTEMRRSPGQSNTNLVGPLLEAFVNIRSQFPSQPQ